VWLEQATLQRLVMVISSVDTQEVLERWTFMVQTSTDTERKGCVYMRGPHQHMRPPMAIVWVSFAQAAVPAACLGAC
jgi:hypothetical protein